MWRHFDDENEAFQRQVYAITVKIYIITCHRRAAAEYVHILVPIPQPRKGQGKGHVKPSGW